MKRVKMYATALIALALTVATILPSSGMKGTGDFSKEIIPAEREIRETGNTGGYTVLQEDPLTKLRRQYPNALVEDARYSNDIGYRILAEGIEKYKDTIILFHGNPECLISDWNRFFCINDFRYFWVEHWWFINYGDYLMVNFQYMDTPENINRMIKQVDAVYKKIEQELAKCNDVWDEAKYTYDYLVKTITYDRTLSHRNIRNIYGALVEKDAVCTGYAMAFDYIMSRRGYPVGIVGNPDHYWNYIYWNSKETFVDATWGDPDLVDKKGNAHVDYTFFGMSYSELAAYDSHEIKTAYISERGFDNNIIPEKDYSFGGTTTNYCNVMGYNVGNYSYDAVKKAFKTQYKAKDNTLIVKFKNSTELQKAKNDLCKNKNKKLNKILSGLGYKKAYRYKYYDNGTTFVVFLNVK